MKSARNQPAEHKSWQYQEQLKGRTIAGKVLGSNYGGWGFNYLYLKKSPGCVGGKGPVMPPVELKPDEAAVLRATVFTDEALREEPFFRPGSNRGKISTWTHDAQGKPSLNTEQLGLLYGTTTGSAFAERHRDTLLAQMIPALSLVTGQDAVEKFGNPATNFNFDINTPAFRGDTATPPWPASRLPDRNWRHSDLRAVAYPYVRVLYKKLSELGQLNQLPP